MQQVLPHTVLNLQHPPSVPKSVSEVLVDAQDIGEERPPADGLDPLIGWRAPALGAAELSCGADFGRCSRGHFHSRSGLGRHGEELARQSAKRWARPETGPSDGSATLCAIGAATGRTDRMVRMIAAFDSENRSQPLKVLPLHSSHTVPGGTRTLSTVKGAILVVGDETVMLGPLKWPFAYNVTAAWSCAATGAGLIAMSAAKTKCRIPGPLQAIGHRPVPDRSGEATGKCQATGSSRRAPLRLQAGSGVGIGFLPLGAPIAQFLQRDADPVIAHSTWSPLLRTRKLPGR